MRRVCVLGLGYIGLPTAAMLAVHGFQVTGVDTDERVLKAVGARQFHTQEPGLAELVARALESGNLQTAPRPQPADAFVIAVPTPCAHGPQPAAALPRADLSYVAAATESIVPVLQGGNLVVLESTVPPGTTEGLLAAILAGSGLPVTGDGAGVMLAHCPERVLPGRILDELVRNDRIIGGIDRPSAERARELYASFAQGAILLTDATTAELVKLMENTYRDVNIALANEFALVAERVGVDIWEAIELANRHPRVSVLKPGPGVGGHCIAVDPWFIAQVAPEATPLIQTARRVNDRMPGHVVGLVKEAVAGVPGPVVACLGLAYKANVDDLRESPALEVVRQLRAEGMQVRTFDPLAGPVPGLESAHCRSLAEAVAGADCAVILTDHRELEALQPEALAAMRHRIVVDTRNALHSPEWQRPGSGRIALGAGRARAFSESGHCHPEQVLRALQRGERRPAKGPGYT